MGYGYVKEKGNWELAEKIVREYIEAINDIYENELEEEALLDLEAEMFLVASDERNKVLAELHKDFGNGNYTPENEMYEVIGDWFDWEVEVKQGCKELKELLWEALYNLEEDYYMAYYILWSLADMPKKENPFLPYFKLWCMGLRARFVAKDKVIVL